MYAVHFLGTSGTGKSLAVGVMKSILHERNIPFIHCRLADPISERVDELMTRSNPLWKDFKESHHEDRRRIWTELTRTINTGSFRRPGCYPAMTINGEIDLSFALLIFHGGKNAVSFYLLDAALYEAAHRVVFGRIQDALNEGKVVICEHTIAPLRKEELSLPELDVTAFHYVDLLQKEFPGVLAKSCFLELDSPDDIRKERVEQRQGGIELPLFMEYFGRNGGELQEKDRLSLNMHGERYMRIYHDGMSTSDKNRFIEELTAAYELHYIPLFENVREITSETHVSEDLF